MNVSDSDVVVAGLGLATVGFVAWWLLSGTAEDQIQSLNEAWHNMR